jgi:DNA end-binding protein Ku
MHAVKPVEGRAAAARSALIAERRLVVEVTAAGALQQITAGRRHVVAIGKVVFTSREHIIAVEARDKGMMGITLRYPYEVRKQAEYFEDIEDEKVPKDMLELALHIVDTKRGDFEPEKFEDQYEDALKELLRKKQKGEKIERPREPARSNVVNLMDALRQSVQAETGNASERQKVRSSTHHASRKANRSPTRHKKAG